MTQYTLHKLPKGFTITSDEKIKKGDKMYDFHLVGICDCTDVKQGLPYSYTSSFINVKKVIAQQDQIDFSDLKEEEQKQIGWFGVESILDGECYNVDLCYSDFKIYEQGYRNAFQKAQELLSDRIFTLEDIYKVIEMSKTLTDGINNFDVENILGSSDGTYGIKERYTQKQIIHSLFQSKSWEIIGNWKDNKFKITKIL